MTRATGAALAALFLLAIYLLTVIGTQHAELERLRDFHDQVCKQPPALVPRACGS